MRWQPKERPKVPPYWPRLWDRDYRRWWHKWLTGGGITRMLMTGDWRQP